MAKVYQPKYLFIVPTIRRVDPETGEEVIYPRCPRGGYTVLEYLDDYTKALIRPSKTAESYLLERKYAQAIPIKKRETITYHIKLRTFETDVEVPKEIRGLRNVADYICNYLAEKYAKKMLGRSPNGLTEEEKKERLETLKQNWYDSHIDPIISFLLDLRTKLEARV